MPREPLRPGRSTSSPARPLAAWTAIESRSPISACWDGLSQPIPGDASTTPIYSGEDLDLSLPIVGRAWGDSMDFSAQQRTPGPASTPPGRQTSPNACTPADSPTIKWLSIRRTGASRISSTRSTVDTPAVMGYHALPAEPYDPNPKTDETAAASGECANTAMADVYGAIRGYTDLNDGLRSGIGIAIDSFPESDAGIAATTEWATCMAELGHQYPSRLDRDPHLCGPADHQHRRDHHPTRRSRLRHRRRVHPATTRLGTNPDRRMANREQRHHPARNRPKATRRPTPRRDRSRQTRTSRLTELANDHGAPLGHRRSSALTAVSAAGTTPATRVRESAAPGLGRDAERVPVARPGYGAGVIGRLAGPPCEEQSGERTVSSMWRDRWPGCS